MSETRELVLPSKAQHAIDVLAQADRCLANARTLGEVINLRAKAQAARVWRPIGRPTAPNPNRFGASSKRCVLARTWRCIAEFSRRTRHGPVTETN